LLASDAIREFGSDAVLLCIYIASREDQLHYSKPPAFWRSELMEKIGKRSPKDFIRVRDVAIKSGLLAHVKGSRTSPGLYWTMLPDWLENKFEAFPKRNGKNAKRSRNGTGNGTLSITHNPTPNNTLSTESNSLKPQEVTEQTWVDFVAHRKARKSPITRTALTRIQNEANKAGWTLEEALCECVAQGWTGFKADWCKNSLSNRAKPSPSIPQKKPYALPARETA
jgi:hypothetical protein